MRKTSGISNGKSQYEQIKEETDFEMMNQRQYLHMIQRMQADLVSTQINANEMMDANKQKMMVMGEETDKHRQAL